jgi:tRNA uridine 5-carbamoylmethylation protein Kti12
MNNYPLVINLFGGPGCGKSTTAAELFALLKKQGINAELVTEYAKDLTWQESFNVLRNQIYVFAKQHHRLWRIKNKVQVIITDSPLLMSIVYGMNYGETYKKFVKEEHDRYNNFNVLLRRPGNYQEIGRNQTLDQAKEIDLQVIDTVLNNGYTFDLYIETNNTTVPIIADHILKLLNNKL